MLAADTRRILFTSGLRRPRGAAIAMRCIRDVRMQRCACLSACQALCGCVLNFAASPTPTFNCRTEFQGRMDRIQNRAVPLQDKALSRVEHRTCVLGEPSESIQ